MSKNVIGIQGLAILACAALGLTACPKRVCETPPDFHLTLQASKHLNPDAQGRSLSAVVLVLQLKELTRIKIADFSEVRQHPKEVLADDLLGEVLEVAVNPGETDTRWVPRAVGARFVAVIGVFREPVENRWWDWHVLGDIPAYQCRPPAADVNKFRWPRPDEEQVRFLLQGSEIERARLPQSSEREWRGTEGGGA